MSLSSIARRLMLIQEEYGTNLENLPFHLLDDGGNSSSWLKDKLPSRSSTKRKKERAKQDVQVLERELTEIETAVRNCRNELVGTRSDGHGHHADLVDSMNAFLDKWEDRSYASCIALAETIVEKARRKYDVDPLGDYNIVYRGQVRGR